MLEHVPGWLGALLKNVRAGHAKLVIAEQPLDDVRSIDLSSPAFAAGGRLPELFTADGEGVSPPLVWGALPEGTSSLALIVEDPDAPALHPFVHAVVWNIPSDTHTLAEGAISADGNDGGADVGRNSYLTEGWLPPDPPTGHGSHDYVFQLFALAETVPVAETPGRNAVVEAIGGRILAAGVLVGTYSRGEPSDAAASEALGSASPI